jgi:gamma-glutamyltranspeptidase / glutathione hydrolase
MDRQSGAVKSLALIPFFLLCHPAQAAALFPAETYKPPLHGRHWMAITGKPLAATAGARMFERGGNAIDAACAMLAAACTMHDDVGWGGETQALIFNPLTGKVIGVNACGVAPSGATPDFFKEKKMNHPPGEGPLAAITPGNPGGLMVMLAEFGTLSLREVLEPAIQLAKAYPIEAELVRKIHRNRDKLKQWPYSKKVFLGSGDQLEIPRPGELWSQPDLLSSLEKLVEAESRALKEGKNRKQAIYAAYDRFYKGDIGAEFARATQEQGGLITVEDLAGWSVKLEEPVSTIYKGIEVYKLTTWTQGPVLLQALNLLEPLDLQSMGYNSSRYIHAVYQAMNLAFADRDFYYGDPAFAPATPLAGLLSKEYAHERLKQVNWKENNPDVRPGDPYPFQGDENPFLHLLKEWSNIPKAKKRSSQDQTALEAAFHAGTTSIQAADKAGWVISVTPSGGWLPACIAGRTGMGLSQRLQSFVLDEAENPFNLLAPGKQPRVTLTPTLALKEGRPFLCFSVQGGDSQDQNLLQLFLNMVEFDMTVQEACEAANFTSYQMRSSFGSHEAQPGRLTLNHEVPSWVRRDLRRMGYSLDFSAKTSGPLTAIFFDHEHGSFWGGASHHGEDYGITW